MAIFNKVTQADISNVDEPQTIVNSQTALETLSHDDGEIAGKTIEQLRKSDRTTHNTIVAPFTAEINRISLAKNEPVNHARADKVELAGLPLEILTMIAACLLEGCLETMPKAPEPHKYSTDTAELVELDLRVREMSFFAAIQVNQSLREACRVAFVRRVQPILKCKAATSMHQRIRLEERFIRRFDGLQHKLLVFGEKFKLQRAEERDKRVAEAAEKRALAKKQYEELVGNRLAQLPTPYEERYARMEEMMAEHIEQMACMVFAQLVDKTLRRAWEAGRVLINRLELQDQCMKPS